MIVFDSLHISHVLMAISTALRETKLENNKFQNVLHHQQEVMANEFIYVLNFHFQRNTHFEDRLDIFP